MTDQQKNIGLVAGFLILLLISYQFSIKKTLELKDSASELKKEKEMLSNASQRIFDLQQENKYLDSILQKKEISIENSFQQTLLQKLNSFQKIVPVEIISFNEPHTFEENNTILKTYSFEIKGEFSSLIKLMNTLERQQLGKLISVDFEKKRNYRKNKEELIGNFYLQKLEQKN
ncbi:hypothetical protein [Polaribacter glomeratus]|uniref:Pilus assembly protein PilO n=1 Tax=Polaribacter glomeratus TaxID=102 RepID=A0A2S7WFZ5_9FLAO|nr:hypothetical protein [Polaribacter glomeratus]PQJ76535.1 hypothetical protein BTO16_11560 [Polaribacter glomeratus]TXD64161.1 hypothetical protein ESX12_15735 [Polaribacter glomeratus]